MKRALSTSSIQFLHVAVEKIFKLRVFHKSFITHQRNRFTLLYIILWYVGFTQMWFSNKLCRPVFYIYHAMATIVNDAIPRSHDYLNRKPVRYILSISYVCERYEHTYRKTRVAAKLRFLLRQAEALSIFYHWNFFIVLTTENLILCPSKI